MSKKSLNRSGFTLVEVMIVVVIMAILAATIIPQFSDSSKDAKKSTAILNLNSLRSQIEMYKSQHDGKSPTATLVELYSKTNTTGSVGTGAGFTYGPYMTELPTNPFNHLSSVGATSSSPPTAGTGANGWLYHAATGTIFIDDPDLYTE